MTRKLLESSLPEVPVFNNEFRLLFKIARRTKENVSKCLINVLGRAGYLRITKRASISTNVYNNRRISERCRRQQTSYVRNVTGYLPFFFIRYDR